MFWHQLTKTQLENELKTNFETGLTSEEAQVRLKKYGLNALPEAPRETWLTVFLSQFKSPLIYMLVACSLVVFLLGDSADAGIILVVLIINALIGAYQEGKSGKILESLKKLSKAEATVLRDGRKEVVQEQLVVPGDIMLLSEGQKIVADGRVIFSSSLGMDESMLTGESGSVMKNEAVLAEEVLSAAQKHNMVFKGTNVLTGDGKAVAVATGQKTEMGKIAQSLMLPPEEIPLQKNIRAFSELLVKVVSVIGVLVFVFGLLIGRDAREMFSLVVSLTVSTIPEGLPLVLTVILATGVYRMSKKNALVKKMQAVEALGQAEVIAVDKTGTITKNEMIVKKLFLGDRIYEVSGSGYEPQGGVMLAGESKNHDEDVLWAAVLGSLSTKGEAIFQENESVYKVVGDPTEAAVSVFGSKLGKSRRDLLTVFKEVEEIPFDYKNKYRAVYFEHGGKYLCAVLGAAEVLHKNSDKFLSAGQQKKISALESEKIIAAEEEFAGRGLRAVAVGYKWSDKKDIENGIVNLTFAGIFGIEDSVRPEALEAVKKARELGVKIVMITGDHKQTARSIAKEAGIFFEGDEIITGQELAAASDANLISRLEKTSVFARITPEDKMRIINLYKRGGKIVAMTGDGVNDAPSLVAADLGVAMGRIGTEVAKEAGDIVLLDDNLMSIVSAISEGRVMYRNIKKTLQFIFSTASAALLTIVASLAFNMPLPVLAVQILWLNLVTDPLLGIALATEKSEHNAEMRLTKGFSKHFVDKQMAIHMVLVSVVMAAGTLYLFNVYRPVNETLARSVALTALCAFQWVNAFNCRFLERSILSVRIFSNKLVWLAFFMNIGLQIFALHTPFMQKILKTQGLGSREWVFIAVISLVIIILDEIRKYFVRRPYRKVATV